MIRCSLKYILLFAFTLPTASAEASPWAAQNNSLFTEEQTPDAFSTKFQESDSELDLNLGLAYSSFDGPTTDFDFAYRFAPARRFLIGLGGAYSTSELTQSFAVGPEARLYLLEFRRWAVSFTQKFQWSRVQRTFPNVGEIELSGLQFRMASAVGAHFYISPNASFNIAAEATYFPTEESLEASYSILPKVGLTLRF